MGIVTRRRKPREDDLGLDPLAKVCRESDNTIDKLLRIKAEEYDPCKIADISSDQCSDFTYAQREIAGRIARAEEMVSQSGKLVSDGRRDEAMAKLKEAAIIIKSLNVRPSTVSSFWQYFREEGQEQRLIRLLGRVGGRQFLAVPDPRDGSFVLTFDPAMKMTSRPSECGMGMACSYVSIHMLGASTFSDLMDELKSWVQGAYRCAMPFADEPEPPLVASAEPNPQPQPVAPTPPPEPEPIPEPEPEPAPPPAPKPPAMAAPRPPAKKTPPAKKVTPTVKKVTPPAKKPAPPVKKPATARPSAPPRRPNIQQPPPLEEMCLKLLPAKAKELWAKSKPASQHELAGTSWIRCGFNSITKDSALQRTPLRTMRFDLMADRLHLKMGDGKNAGWATYGLSDEYGRLVGMHEDPSQWMIPPGLGGPRGNWGPLEIRKLGRDLLIYFRIPSSDGKDYHYAYAIARRGEAI